MSSTTGEQFELLISFMEKNPGIAKNFLNMPQFKETSNHLWGEVIKQLNSAGGPEKTVDGWKKVWKDFKYATKNKLKYNKKQLTGTGGGPYKLKKLSPLEERVDQLLDLTGEIEGIKIKTFGCKIPTPSQSFGCTELSLTNTEFEAEILLELDEDEPDYPLVNKIHHQITSSNIKPAAIDPLNHSLLQSTSQAFSTIPSNITPAPIASATHSPLKSMSNAITNSTKETSKMILKRQVEIQKNHFENFKDYAENCRKYQSQHIKELKEKRAFKKEKWKAKQKILLQKNKYKVEELELERKELDLREQELRPDCMNASK